MPEIKDIIIHGPYKQVFIVLDKKPEFKYERKGSLLIASDDGCYSCYGFERPVGRMKAFAGREFDIPLKNGGVEHANGQWWDHWPRGWKEETISCGIGTLEDLRRCYVFTGCHVSKAKIAAWLENNEPSSNYCKYDEKQSKQVTTP